MVRLYNHRRDAAFPDCSDTYGRHRCRHATWKAAADSGWYFTVLHALQAIFVVCLYNRGELQPFQEALAPLGVTDADLRDMERDCRLRIAFSLVPAHPQHAPVKKLHLSGKMEALAGQLPSELWLPSYGSQARHSLHASRTF